MLKTILKKYTPSQILLSSFVFIILIGTILLMMPFSKTGKEPVNFLVAIFTATSAVSVTGLSVVDVPMTFTKFGQIVILVLIQLGGLGIMTFSSLIMMAIGRRITYQEKKILMEDLNQDGVGGIVRFIRKLITTVIFIESVGAVLIFISLKFIQHEKTGKAIYYAIFHSISAFCNAGFALFVDEAGTSNSLVNFTGDYLMNITISLLIVLGGIGFAVIYSFTNYLKGNKKALTLTSKVAVSISLGMLIIGTILIFITEYPNDVTLGSLSFFDKIFAAFFQSVTTRTAGFNTISISALRPGTIFIFLLFMFIGASPGSTGGGVKTTTFGVIMFSVIAIIRNKKDIEIGNRRISWHILNRAVAILIISLSYCVIVIFAILIYEEKRMPDLKVIKYVFEVISAFGTVGLSMDLTPKLSSFSKIMIMLTMFIGRVGPLTFALALGENLKTMKYRYPRENILVG